MPISISHTLIGATLGVGLAKGIKKVRMEVIKPIFFSWAITIPITAALAAILTKVLI